jgi:hypothetical protein
MKESDADRRWQNQLQRFMKGGILLLVIIFIVISYVGMRNVKSLMDKSPVLQIDTSFISKYSSNPGYEQQAVTGLMESYVVASRYHQARILTMTNVWTQYLGFLTGMLLAFIGSIFILGKIKEDVSNIDVKDLLRFTITSSSPGIILAFFGTVLMLSTINIKHELNIKDDSVYLRPPVNVTYGNKGGTDKPAEWNTETPSSASKEDSLSEIEMQKIKDKYGKQK